jgi:hypothetical protein
MCPAQKNFPLTTSHSQKKGEANKMLKIIQLKCPNPNCQKTFKNLIVVKDRSKNPPEIFYACPHCLTKLDPTATQVLEKEETEKQPEPPTTPITTAQPTTNPEPENCPFYYKYLSRHYKDTIIPHQCLDCPKMFECAQPENEIENEQKNPQTIYDTN